MIGPWAIRGSLALILVGAACSKTEADSSNARTDAGDFSQFQSGDPGFPQPQQDLSRDRLEQRAGQAAQRLRELGCTRLLYWKWSQPTGDLELLRFETEAGAQKRMAEEAGSERRRLGPGEEASVGDSSLHFRRGKLYARLVAAGPEPEAVLIAAGRRLDRAITGGLVKP